MRLKRLFMASYCGTSIRCTFRFHLPPYICALVFAPAIAAIIYAANAPFNLDLSLYFLGMLPGFFAVGLSIAAMDQYAILAVRRCRTPVNDFVLWLRRDAFSPGNIFHTVVTITPLLIAFSALKSVTPLLDPFSWDPTFEQWDRLLGFGVDAIAGIILAVLFWRMAGIVVREFNRLPAFRPASVGPAAFPVPAAE